MVGRFRVFEVGRVHLPATVMVRNDELRSLHRLQLGVYSGECDPGEVGKLSD